MKPTTKQLLDATNRHFGGPNPVQFTKADLVEQFYPNWPEILAAVSSSLPVLPHSKDGQLEVKWGHDDEGVFGSLPPNEGDEPDSNNPAILEHLGFGSWVVLRTANALYIVPNGSSGAGPVALWFTPTTFDTGEPQAHGYVDQD